MAGKVTLREIAQEAGVSVSAVSLVLNNRPCRVSDAARARIKEVARKKRYIPNQIARSLVTKRSNTLGLIVPNITSRYFSSIARDIELRAREQGYTLFIMNSGEGEDSAALDAELLQLLINRGADGIFLVVSNEAAPAPELVDTLTLAPVPVMLVDRSLAGVPCDKVRFDSERGGYLACRHLLEQGHRRIACMVNLRSHTGEERLTGYRRALSDAGVAYDEGLVFQSTYYIADAYRAAAGVIGTDATAVFASSDNIALGLLKRVYAQGLRVPQDLSVVSYDNSAADALFEPALTAIEQNASDLAARAMEQMLTRLAEQDAGEDAAEPVEMLLSPRLVINESVRDLG